MSTTIRYDIANIPEPGGGGGISGTATTFAGLPSASSHTDELWRVTSASGVWPVNRKAAGIYESDGTNWNYVTDYTEHDQASELTNDSSVSGTTIKDALNSLFFGKQDTITGGASTIVSSNLTANRALVSNGSGKVAVSTVTDTVLGYMSGVTSGVQSQINGKMAQPTAVLGITAAGTTQGTATALSGNYSIQEVTTVAANTGVKLPTATATSRVCIVNRGANILKVYPNTSGTINGLSANTFVWLRQGCALEFVGKNGTAWYTFPSYKATGAAITTSDQDPSFFTLANSGVIGGSYGASNVIPVFTVGYDGRITSVFNTAVSISYSQIYDFASGVALYAPTSGLTRGKTQALAENSGA